MVKSSDIEQPRSPSELREFVIRHREAIEADESELHRGVQKEGLNKQFLEEVIPLSRFAVLAYPDSYRVQPVLGNQRYDALVYNELGEEVDRIEITTPHDGIAESQDARLVVERGYSQIHVGDPGEDFDALFSHVLTTCRKKAQKDYSDCTLVVAIAPMPPFQSFEERYERQIKELLREMAQIEFKAKRVFLCVLPDRVIGVRQISATARNNDTQL